MTATNQTTLQWYAIRVTYSRELLLKTYLDERLIENFIPMHYEMVLKNGKQSKKLVPVIHNLVFVHIDRRRLDAIKQEIDTTIPIRYIMDKERRTPIVIPQRQMQHFIAVSGTNDEQLLYIPLEKLRLKQGDKVRITGGLFSGVEGEFVRIKGDRRVVVAIPGFMAVATAFIHPSLLSPVS